MGGRAGPVIGSQPMVRRREKTGVAGRDVGETIKLTGNVAKGEDRVCAHALG